jgi:hypothetical protein
MGMARQAAVSAAATLYRLFDAHLLLFIIS